MPLLITDLIRAVCQEEVNKDGFIEAATRSIYFSLLSSMLQLIDHAVDIRFASLALSYISSFVIACTDTPNFVLRVRHMHVSCFAVDWILIHM